MSAPTVTLEAIEDGAGPLYCLRGTLDFSGVPGLLEIGQRIFPDSGTVRLDLGGLDGVNSAGLALLLEWQNAFQRSGRGMKLLNVPATLINIARVSELESILALPS